MVGIYKYLTPDAKRLYDLMRNSEWYIPVPEHRIRSMQLAGKSTAHLNLIHRVTSESVRPYL